MDLRDPSLTAFVARFLENLAREGPETLKEKIRGEFWYSRKVAECAILPWSLLAAARPTLTSVKYATADSGFLGFTGENGGEFPFSFLKEGDQWRLDYFNRDIMRAYAAEWPRSGALRFYVPPSKEQIEFVTKACEEANRWVASELESEPLTDLDYYFDVVSALLHDLYGKESPPGARFSGEANSGMLLFGGEIPQGDYDSRIFLRSTIVHEHVHVYTWYRPDWSHRPNELSVAQPLLSEGIATYFQMRYLSLNSSASEERPAIDSFMNGLKGAKAFQGRLLDLLDANRFRSVEQRTGYLLGASLIYALKAKIGAMGLKRFWRSLEASRNIPRVEASILAIVSDPEISARAADYLREVESILAKFD